MYQVNALSLVTLTTNPDESLKSSNEQKGSKQEFLHKTVLLVQKFSIQKFKLLIIHAILKFRLRESFYSETAREKFHFTSLKWFYGNWEAFGFNSSTEFTIEKHKSYFITLSKFLISLELPKKKRHGTVLRLICSPYTEHTWLSLFYSKEEIGGKSRSILSA